MEQTRTRPHGARPLGMQTSPPSPGTHAPITPAVAQMIITIAIVMIIFTTITGLTAIARYLLGVSRS